MIAIFYILPSFAIGVGTAFSDISTDTGLLDSYGILADNAGFDPVVVQNIICIVGALFILTLISNISSWNFGVYSVIAFAAKDGMFPKSWSKRNKDGVPYMVGIWTGIVAAILAVVGIVLAYAFPEWEALQNMFWAFFDLSLVCLLLSYIPMFAAFIKLHKKGEQVRNGYWLKIGPVMRWIMGVVPLFLLGISLFFTLIPEFSMEAIADNATLIVSTAVCVLIGEIMICNMVRKDNRKKLARRTKTASRARK